MHMVEILNQIFSFSALFTFCKSKFVCVIDGGVSLTGGLFIMSSVYELHATCLCQSNPQADLGAPKMD